MRIMESQDSRRIGVIRGVVAGLALTGLLYFSYLMLRITLQYVPIQDDVAFLRIKQEYLPIAHWKLAFFIHVFTSMFALAAGFTQFVPQILRRWPAVHCWMGWLYVVNVCLITGPASFIMALYANGGFSSRLAFTILAVLWIGTTWLAVLAVRRGDFRAHRAWMIRSYALTVSAITLRVWKLGLAVLLEPRPMDLYRVVAWLGFIPNLIVAEIIIRSFATQGTNRATQHESKPTGRKTTPATAPR